jgi:hypothetical protein
VRYLAVVLVTVIAGCSGAYQSSIAGRATESVANPNAVGPVVNYTLTAQSVVPADSTCAQIPPDLHFTTTIEPNPYPLYVNAFQGIPFYVRSKACRVGPGSAMTVRENDTMILDVSADSAGVVKVVPFAVGQANVLFTAPQPSGPALTGKFHVVVQANHFPPG